MTLVWLGVLVLAFSWMRAVPAFYRLPDAVSWVVVGVLLLVVGLRNLRLWDSRPSRFVSVIVLVAGIIGIAWLDGPFRVGFVLLAIAATLTLVPIPRVVHGWIMPGLWVSSFVYLVQSAFVPLLYVFMARYHATADIPFLHDALPGFPSIPWLAGLLYGPLKLINPDTSISGPTLYLRTVWDTQPLTPTWEKLGLMPLWLFSVGAAVVVLIRPQWRRRLTGLVVCICVYAYVRLLVLFLLVNQVRTERFFWQYDYVFYSFLLLPFVLGAWWKWGASWRWRGDTRPLPERPSLAGRMNLKMRVTGWFRRAPSGDAPFEHRVRTRRVVFAVALLVGGIVAFHGFHDPGTAKRGRILIDEEHSNWEWTTQPFDTTWYGGRSGYNYYCLADYWNHFYHVETRSDSLTPEYLSGWDVVVIKTPTSAYSAEEIEALVDFVRRGGGLFIIGDHTNVFGTSTYLNPIAERFGMYFRYDATYDLVTLGLTLYEKPQRFAHPVVHAMPEYLFATSCTMYAPPLSENVIIGYGLRAMYLDYSETSYFPTKEDKLDYDFGLFMQAGGVKYGKGRVLGFTDSTCFSNFFMFIPGKPELAMASIEWLNRTNRWSWLGRVFLIAALIGFALVVIEARCNSGASFWTTAAVTGTITVVILGSILDAAVRRSYARPSPHRNPTYVTFDQSHGGYQIPSKRLVVNSWQNFQTFYVWTQRLGLIPRNEDTLAGAVSDSRALLEIQPSRPFSIEDVDQIMNFVRRGGTLVVLDSPENVHSTSATLLGPFNISFEEETADSAAVLNETGDTLGLARKAYAVKDVVPVLRLGDGRTTMGYRQFENGYVVVCGAAWLFSSEAMGSTAVVPNEQQRRIYRTEYEIFEKIAGLRVRARYHLPETSSGLDTTTSGR